jgi:hypothetical protein
VPIEFQKINASSLFSSNYAFSWLLKKTRRREYVFLNFLERLSAQCLFKQKIAGVTGFFGMVKG